MPNYWGYRIDRNNIDFFRTELQDNKTLRQGWGYDCSQDLRKPPGSYDGDSHRNRSIYNNVKKGDILLVPHLPELGKVAVVRATADFDKGYYFDIPDLGDYGHCFPAELVKEFHRHASAVSGDIRTTLRCRCRFWNINRYSDDIRRILDEKDPRRLGVPQTERDRLRDLVAKWDKDKPLQALVKSVYEDLDKEFEAKNWEMVLQEMIQALHPDWNVEHVGGQEEAEHGTDLLVTIPSISADEHAYGIAIQVKDQTDLTDHALDQISKSTEYWKGQRDLKIIDTYVIVTKAEPEDDPPKGDTKVIRRRELGEMVKKYALLRLAKESTATGAWESLLDQEG